MQHVHCHPIAAQVRLRLPTDRTDTTVDSNALLESMPKWFRGNRQSALFWILVGPPLATLVGGSGVHVSLVVWRSYCSSKPFSKLTTCPYLPLITPQSSGAVLVPICTNNNDNGNNDIHNDHSHHFEHHTLDPVDPTQSGPHCSSINRIQSFTKQPQHHTYVLSPL